MFAIRDDRYVQLLSWKDPRSNIFAYREYIQQEDLTKAARKVGEAKKHESKYPTHFDLGLRGYLTLITLITAKLDVSA